LTLSISNLSYGKTPQFYSVGESIMRTMNNKIQLYRMLDVVHKECDKKIYVTKTDIIEHKDDLEKVFG